MSLRLAAEPVMTRLRRSRVKALVKGTCKPPPLKTKSRLVRLRMGPAVAGVKAEPTALTELVKPAGKDLVREAGGFDPDELAAEVAFGEVRVELHPTDGGAAAAIDGAIEGPEAVFGEGAGLADLRAIGQGAAPLDDAGGRDGHGSVAVAGGAGGVGRDGDSIGAALGSGVVPALKISRSRIQLGHISREAVGDDALEAVGAGEVQAEAHGEQLAGNQVEGVGCQAGQGAELAGNGVVRPAMRRLPL